MRESIQYTLNYIRSRIPQEVLDLTFRPQNPYLQDTTDNGIITEVIEPRVLADCNIVSGKLKYIPLLPEYSEEPQNLGYAMPFPIGHFGLYRIPPEARENVPITQVVSISHPINNFGGASVPANMGTNDYSNCPWVNMNQMAEQVLESRTYNSTPPVPTPELMGSNIIRLTPPQLAQINWVLGCKLAYDPELTNLPNSALIPFAELCVYATQMKIYNYLIVKLDRGMVEGGTDITSIRAIVESYQDAHERYSEALLRFRGGAILDTRTKLLLLQHMM